MNKKELLATLATFDIHPGKALGQNFLIDSNLLDYIVRCAAIESDATVLEVGPGLGVLTKVMLAAGAKVIAIEFDHRLCRYLRKQFNQENNFSLLEGDACKVDYATLLQGVKFFQAIANLPYSISSIFIARMLELESPPIRMLFMLQKEMGLRLAAKTNSGDYGALSARTQLLYSVKILRFVPPQVFFPAPEVDSAIVEFILKPVIPAPSERQAIEILIKRAFAQKRKQIFRPLLANYSELSLSNALDELGIARSARPAELSPEQYWQLSRLLHDDTATKNL